MFTSSDRIREYVGTDSSYVEYSKFEGKSSRRSAAKKSFSSDETYVPNYDYPKLDGLHDRDADGAFLYEKKRRIYEAVLELEAHKDSGIMIREEFELYAAYHENRLKKIMLTEAAKRMRQATSSSALATARQEFMSLCKEIYGELDHSMFDGMMHTEQQRVANFVPAGERSASIKQYLDSHFDHYHYETEEQPLLEKEVLLKLRDAIEKRYEDVLAVIPDTDDDRIYDADECREIVQSALDASGLGVEGWKCEVNADKSNPATDADEKKIYLPEDTMRTAEQLKRLVLHEEEVHARRAFNGQKHGILALEKGTAGYADVEEGLGLLLECAITGELYNQSYHRARDRYITAGLALGADGTPRDARQTYEILWRLIAVRQSSDGVITNAHESEAKELAMSHIENAYRGTDFAGPGIIYTKLKVYYEGLTKNAQYFIDNQDDIDGALDRAMIGKYNHTDQVEQELVHSVIAA